MTGFSYLPTAIPEPCPGHYRPPRTCYYHAADAFAINDNGQVVALASDTATSFAAVLPTQANHPGQPLAAQPCHRAASSPPGALPPRQQPRLSPWP